MTKEKWIKLRKLEELPLEVMYDYYMENKKEHHINLTLNQFEIYFSKFIPHVFPIYNKILFKVMSYYEKKYNFKI
jgi:hypothetical protein